jgi:hypothetical protein
MKMKIRFLIFVIVSLLLAACDDTVYIGTARDGFRDTPGNTITPARAKELAGPYLAECFTRRQARRLSPHRGEPTDIVVQEGNWYYVTRDNYPYKTLGAYTHRAVRVHVRTGEVVNGCGQD